MTNAMFRARGFTLMELVIYVAIVAIILSAIVILAFQLSDIVIKIRTKTEVISNARLAMERILSEINYAKAVYTPTSDLVSDIGRLSLATRIDVPSGENQTYVDFYIVGGQLFIKREGQLAEALTSSGVAITRLKFTRMNVSATSEGVMVELGLRENPRAAKASGQIDFALQSTAAMRGNK